MLSYAHLQNLLHETVSTAKYLPIHNFILEQLQFVQEMRKCPSKK